MAEKKFIKGLFKDTGHIDQPEATWRYALNAFLNDKEGSISNEGGTWPNGRLPHTYSVFHPSWPDAEHMAVIGTINVDDDRVVLFLKDIRTETSVFYPVSMIVIWEEASRGTPGYTNGIKILLSDYMLYVHNLKPLNFNINNRIEGTYKIDSREDLIIYWTDDLNPPRALNISRQERAFGTGFLGYMRIYGIIVGPGSNYDHVDILNLFPNSGPVPHISFFTTFNAITGMAEQQSVTTGGGLLTGVYYLALAYTDIDFVSTNFLTVSNPVSIVTEYDHTRPTFRNAGAKDGSQTTKAINWKVTNLNTNYKYLKPVVIRKMGDAVDAFRLNDIDVSIAATEGVVFTGIEGFTKASVEDVIIDTVSYETAKTINQLDGILYLGNLTGTKDLGYQKWANNIKLKAVERDIANFDEFWATTDNLETGFMNQPIDNGNIVDDSKSYRYAPNNFQNRGYMRDEVYAFYIAFIMKDGSMSYAYHIPGRVDQGDETNLLLQSYAVPYNNHVLTLANLNLEYAKRFHMFDYSAVAGNLNMNYWENATEFYPNTSNFDVWDPAVSTTAAASTIQGLNVRHHHFPSNENLSFKTIKGNNITTEVSDGTSGVVTPINGQIIMKQDNIGDGYHPGPSGCGDGWCGMWTDTMHWTNLPGGTTGSLATSHISHSNDGGGTTCSDPGSNKTTYFTAQLPCTVRVNYYSLHNRACYGTGCSNSEVKTRIRTDSTLTAESASTMQEDQINDWCNGCEENSANRSLGTAVIDLLPGEKIWVESWCVATSRTRPGKSGDLSCGNWSNICDWFADFYNQVPNFNPGCYPEDYGSMISFRIESGAAGLNPTDILDAKISHDVSRLGFHLEDIKIPKTIADKIQGFRIFYADRKHENKTILGQSTLNPMHSTEEILGRCEEVVGSTGSFQTMAQLYSYPELYWSKDPWAREAADYPLYNIYNNTTTLFEDMNGYKTFAFHDFTLLRTKNSIAGATHIKPIYRVRNLVWNGPGVEQERKMLSMVTGYGTAAVSIDEYWGWDTGTDPQNCYAREILSAIFIGGDYDNMSFGTGLYELPRLLGQKAKLYLNGDSIFKGQSLGFGGKLFNEFGESVLAFSLDTGHELPALSSSPTNFGGNSLTHWGVHNSLTPAILLNEEFDWTVYSNAEHAKRSEQYLTNLCSFKTDVYKSIDTQKLIWTGFEVLGDDLENFVFDDDTGQPTYNASATWRTNTVHPDGIFGGDTIINRYGYISSLTPNNEAEKANPKRAIYYQIVESQDNINFRHFESDLSLYFPGTPARTLLAFAGGSFNEGTTYDFTKDSEIKYNDNYSELNDLRTAFPLPLRETKQSEFPTRTHRSAKADPTSLIDNWRMFLANNYKDLPKNRGELWKLSTFNNLLYFHMEESLFAAKGKQSMQMKDGSEAFVGSGDIFQQDPDELIQTKNGYGGTQSQWAALTTRAGYFFVDRLSRKVFLMKDKLSDISLVGMEAWFREHLKYRLEDYGLVDVDDNPLTGFGLHSIWDPKYKRIILTKKEIVPTTTFITAYNNGDIRYNISTGMYEEFITAGTPPVGQWFMIHWEETRYFKRSGWTISYLPKLNIWVSFHSYIPYIYFNTSTDFYSLTDRYIDYVNGTLWSLGVADYNTNNPTSTVPTNYGMATIWRHNEHIKGLLYMDIDYNYLKYNFEFEYVENEVKTLPKTFYNISYTLQNFAYNSETGEHDMNVLKHGFTDYFIYNTHQIYTPPTAQNEPDGLEYLINVRKIASEWKINGFRDLAVLATQNAAGGYYMSTVPNIIGGVNTGTLTTLQDEKMIDISYLALAGITWIDAHYSEDLNNLYINFNKPWNQQQKFTDKWAGIRLIYNNIENNLLNLYSTEVGTRKYYR